MAKRLVPTIPIAVPNSRPSNFPCIRLKVLGWLLSVEGLYTTLVLSPSGPEHTGFPASTKFHWSNANMRTNTSAAPDHPTRAISQASEKRSSTPQLQNSQAFSSFFIKTISHMTLTLRKRFYWGWRKWGRRNSTSSKAGEGGDDDTAADEIQVACNLLLHPTPPRSLLDTYWYGILGSSIVPYY